MADNITLVTYAGSQVTPQHDALMHNLGLPNNGIIYGAEVTIEDESTLHINAGVGVIYGREFEIVDSDIAVSLSSSDSLLGQLYVHMDLADTSEPISLVVETASTLTELTDDPEVNINTGVSEMQLATFEVDAETISNLVQTFPTATASAGKTDIATIETTSTASQDYAVGEYLYYNNQLYKVITAITSGDTLVVDTNIEATTVGGELEQINSDLSGLITVTEYNTTPAGTTISLDLSDFKLCILGFRNATPVVIIPNQVGSSLFTEIIAIPYRAYAKITVSATGLTFSDVTGYTTYGSWTESDFSSGYLVLRSITIIK